MLNGFHISDQTIGNLSTELRLDCTIFPLPASPWIPGATSLFWPRWICAAEQGIIFRVFSFKQGINFHYSPSLTWCVFGPEALKGVQGQQMSGLHLWHQHFFPNNSVPWYWCKKYLILNAKRNKSGSKNMVSCLGQSSKMSNFCLYRVAGLEGFSDTPLLKLSLKFPTPGPWIYQPKLEQWRNAEERLHIWIQVRKS